MVVVKRQHIVITALVVLVGVAGYINWQYRDEDTADVASEDIVYNEQFDLTDEAQTAKKLGEAKYVNANTAESETDYFALTKLEREEARSKSIEILTQTASNPNFDAAAKQAAQEQIIQIGKNVEAEAIIESLLRAKGYESLVILSDGAATVTVKFDGLSDSDIAKIKDIVVSNSNVDKNIKIVEVK